MREHGPIDRISGLMTVHLPIFRTAEEAVALAQQHRDLFYVAAFKLQIWISDLLVQAMAEYTEKADPAGRAMQTGQAWHAFDPDLGSVCDEEFHQVMDILIRFAQCENPVSRRLHAALVLVYREHEFTGDFLGPEGLDGSQDPREAGPLLRRTVARMCDWLDAVVHITTHILWFHAPGCFDPDPGKRRLAEIELTQPSAAEWNDATVVFPYLQPRGGAGHQAVSPSSAEGGGVRAGRAWPFPKLDEAVITLWPLVKLHNWTYADLWNVLSQASLPLGSTPCPNHRRLADYCFHNLGLRKSGHGQTSRNSLPAGHVLAERLLGHFRHRSRALGRGPWS